MAPQPAASEERQHRTDIIGWFVPPGLVSGRADCGSARMFVATHLVGGAAGLLTVAYLMAALGPDESSMLATMAALLTLFGSLPLVLRLSGNMDFVSLASFQLLAVVSLIGTYAFGGFASPFLPWLLVSLMSGLFYDSRRAPLILGLFAIDVTIFFSAILLGGQPEQGAALKGLRWASIASATTYMAFMALYYARITASRDELAREAERYRTTLIELEQARTMAEEVSRARSQFLAKMSHELRTPLNAIIGYSEILLEDCTETSPDDSRRLADLGRINATGKHLMSLVSDVLDSDNVETGVMRLDIAHVHLGDICEEVVATATPLMARRGNRLVVDCPSPGDEIHTDARKLRQMLINLLGNAGKFTSDGTVTLELWVERGRADDRLHAAVRDTGIGIAPEALPRLFETYMQADATIGARFGGTGIGLALTRKFAALLGGSVTATSEPGHGSTFTIDVPAEIEEPPAAGAPAERHAA